LGYSELGSFGSSSILTSRLDRMAAEGQKWTNFYVQPVCLLRAELHYSQDAFPFGAACADLANDAAPKVLQNDA
jgi:hypothetical protein